MNATHSRTAGRLLTRIAAAAVVDRPLMPAVAVAVTPTPIVAGRLPTPGVAVGAAAVDRPLMPAVAVAVAVVVVVVAIPAVVAIATIRALPVLSPMEAAMSPSPWLMS